MKLACLILISTLIVACSSDQTYRSLQSMEQSRCAEGPASEYQNCLQNAGMSYEEYEARRGEEASEAKTSESPTAKLPAGQASSDQVILRGRFSMVDSKPWFEDCRNGRSFPVAETGAFSEVQNAYQNSGIKTGESLSVAVRGRILERQNDSDNTYKIMVILDAFESVIEPGDCAPTTTADLQDTYWKLLEIGGIPVVRKNHAGDAHLILNSADARAHGSGGCNRFFAQYRSTRESLRFSAVGSTMMACPEGMETEQVFFNVLGQTQRARITGPILELYGPEGLLARFEAVYPE